MKLQKKHWICWIIYTHGPLSKDQILERVHFYEDKKTPFRRTSNGSYFLPRVHERHPSWGNYNGEKSSVRVQGYVKVAYRTRKGFIYDLTVKGHELVQECYDECTKRRNQIIATAIEGVTDCIA